MMAGTTSALHSGTGASTMKRKRDDVEPDMRQQTCLSCTLSWPWVIFPRNIDGTRKLNEWTCHTCLGISGRDWATLDNQMNECVVKARRKLLDSAATAPIIPASAVNTNRQSITNATTPAIATSTPTAAATRIVQANSASLRPTPAVQSGRPMNPPQGTRPPQAVNPQQAIRPQQAAGPSQTIRSPQAIHAQQAIRPPQQTPYRFPNHPYNHPSNQNQNQNVNNGQTHPDHHLYGMNHAQVPQQQQYIVRPQAQVPAQNQGQAPNNMNHASMYNPLGPLPPVQSSVQYRRPPPPQPQPVDPWIQLFRLPEPTRAFQWVYMNYLPAPGAPPIAQTDLYKHYATSIPSAGYPPLLGGREFIMTTAKHFDGLGVKLDRSNFTIGGLWRRNQPIMIG